MKKLRIGFIGNFQVPFTTENERKWSFEKLGHEVITFQENETSVRDLYDQMDSLDLVIYSHTHGWEIVNLFRFFQACKDHGIPTASVHLDRWAWLAREKDMGQEATWKTEYQFMADGSPEAVELYKELGLKWYFLKAGVVERDCYIAEQDTVSYPHEIVFTGSKGYHPEYPERPIIIEFLKETYGERFGHYGNDGIKVLRGHDLNTLYATAKVVVGDSCFGGRPRYASDRYYEVRGRGGFLLHPQIKGLDNVGVGNYVTGGTFADLKAKIDYFLANSYEREEMRRAGHDWVKRHETYTHRAKEMLEIIFPKGVKNG